MFSPFKFLIKVHSPDDLLPLIIDFLTVCIIITDLFLIPLSLSFDEVSNN